MAKAFANKRALNVNDATMILGAIAGMVKTCKLCPLGVMRTNAVPGEGSTDATIMFVGEGPGQNEDEQGRPFVGMAGNLLEKLLGMIGLKREDVFITNIVKCRPPQNRTPQQNEIDTCKPYLMSQIAALGPKIIVTLGSPSTQTMLGKTVSISTMHGRIQLREGIRFLPMYHPAAYLHKRDPQLLEEMKQDFRELKRILETI